MKFSLIPKYTFENLTDIAPEFLVKRGVRLLLLDMDNTIAPYSRQTPDERTCKWAQSMKRAGIELFIVSNSRRAERAHRFASSLGIGYIRNAMKPSCRRINRLLSRKRFSKSEVALAGDQIYTDTLAANCAGITSIVVRPIELSNIFLAIRHHLEWPFRLIGRIRMKKVRV